jgi:hypothetical protein
MMEAVGTSETPVNFYKTTLRNISEVIFMTNRISETNRGTLSLGDRKEIGKNPSKM